MIDYIHMYGNYPSKKINCKKMIDCPKYLNRKQALLESKGHISELSCTNVRVRIFGALYMAIWRTEPK